MNFVRNPDRKISRTEYTAVIKQNQKDCIEICKTKDSTIRIIPKTLGGSIEHYYHFMFDLVFPLSLVLDKLNSTSFLSIHHFGFLTPIFSKIFGSKVQILPLDKTETPEDQMVLLGMNPDELFVEDAEIDTLIETVFTSLKISKSEKSNKILLIERVPPDPFYFNEAEIKGSGSSRRSISNHRELEKMIRSIINPSYEFHNIMLENISIEDQVRYFNSAVLVIAQHGAGLANLIWMKKGSTVVEIGFRSKTHFKSVSEMMKHDYHAFDYEDHHIHVDIKNLYLGLLNNEGTAKFFKKK